MHVHMHIYDEGEMFDLGCMRMGAGCIVLWKSPVTKGHEFSGGVHQEGKLTGFTCLSTHRNGGLCLWDVENFGLTKLPSTTATDGIFLLLSFFVLFSLYFTSPAPSFVTLNLLYYISFLMFCNLNENCHFVSVFVNDSFSFIRRGWV